MRYQLTHVIGEKKFGDNDLVWDDGLRGHRKVHAM